jgi:RNA polymerase sigma-70 factor (ECF subfamily)
MLNGEGEAVSRRRDTPTSQDGQEALLIGRIAAHDLRAFEKLYRVYHPRLTRFILNMVHRPPLAEEVFHDTMMVVWNRPGAFNGASKVSTWIFAIAYRKALQALRRRDEPVDDPDAAERPSPEPGPEQLLGRARARQALLRAMAELSAEHRAVVDLTYFHEIGYREIAQIMDCPPDTVKTRMFYARRHLRRRLAGGLADWL